MPDDAMPDSKRDAMMPYTLAQTRRWTADQRATVDRTATDSRWKTHARQDERERLCRHIAAACNIYAGRIKLYGCLSRNYKVAVDQRHGAPTSYDVIRAFNESASADVFTYFLHARSRRGSIELVRAHPVFAVLAWYPASTLAPHDGDHAIGTRVMHMLLPPRAIQPFPTRTASPT